MKLFKKCSKCNIEKELTEFSKAKRYKDGLQYKCKSCQKKWREQNKEYNKEYYQQNKKYFKEYYQQNKKYYKQYEEENREQRNKYQKEYRRDKRKIDPLYKMKHNLRTRTYYAFKRKGYSKDTKTQKMLGVDWEVAKQHIERQFTKGMNWDNYGQWQIDHIIPIASANTEQELKKLCHYTNLQPLWAQDNLSKSDKIQLTKIKIRI
jgi:hypothetical protein